jgi:anti-sigma factor (TIGR02949 family)
MTWDECEKCEELMQAYLDRVLDEREVQEAKRHLARCDYCERRYRFEEKLRVFIRQAVAEPMPAELRERLAALRIAL